MMPRHASELAHRLALNAEAVCRHYLPNGRREGRYWLVGDVANTPGRSLFVRLSGPDRGKGAAGKWTDAATGEHGDLLDLIALNRGCERFRDALDEARRFLRMPLPEPVSRTLAPIVSGSISKLEAARRLFAMARPIAGTLVETYLRERAIALLTGLDSLRFHPRCYYWSGPDRPTQSWPAIIAAVTDLDGRLTGVHRTWLDPSGLDKAPVDTPRRALGDLLGNAVRFGVVSEILASGEGIETMLSLRTAMPAMPMIAALSAAHLSAVLLPSGLRRLYIASDRDPAGDGAVATLAARAEAEGIEAIPLIPCLGDFNEDLRKLGLRMLAEGLRTQLASEDVARFLAA
jgi:hypothetical protein